MVEGAASRIQSLYKIFVTQEFVIRSSRALPGEVTFEDGSYEAPDWAEQSDEAGQTTYDNTETREKESVQNTSDLQLSRWPDSARSEASEVGQEKHGPSDSNV